MSAGPSTAAARPIRTAAAVRPGESMVTVRVVRAATARRARRVRWARRARRLRRPRRPRRTQHARRPRRPRRPHRAPRARRPPRPLRRQPVGALLWRLSALFPRENPHPCAIFDARDTTTQMTTAITPRAEIWIAIIISATTEHNATGPPTPLLKPHRALATTGTTPTRNSGGEPVARGGGARASSASSGGGAAGGSGRTTRVRVRGGYGGHWRSAAAMHGRARCWWSAASIVEACAAVTATSDGR